MLSGNFSKPRMAAPNTSHALIALSFRAVISLVSEWPRELTPSPSNVFRRQKEK